MQDGSQYTPKLGFSLSPACNSTSQTADARDGIHHSMQRHFVLPRPFMLPLNMNVLCSAVYHEAIALGAFGVMTSA